MSETKATAAIVVLMSLWSAVCAASTILMFSSPQEAVIAADSLSNRMEGGQRLMCKIRQVSPHMFFVATGIAATENPHFDPYDIARASSLKNESPHEAAMKYARTALGPLQELWRLNRSQYLKIGEGNGSKPTGPQSFAFVGLDHNGNIAIASTNFVEDSGALHTLRVDTFHDITGEKPDDIFFYPMGVTESVPSPTVINSWIYEEKMGAPAALTRGIEVQIKSTPKLVGPPISIVRLSRSGSIDWVSRGECR